MIITILAILILSMCGAIISKRKTVECLPVSIFGITFLMYLLGVLNMLMAAMVIIALLVLLSLIYIINTILKDKKKIFKLIDVGTIIFILLVFFTYYILKDSKVLCYDEFTAWGMFTKTTVESKQLWIHSEFQALAKSYASGTSIFQTFIQFCNFKFSEDLLFMAMNIIYFAMAVNIFKNQKQKNILENVFRGIMILIIPFSIYMWPAFYYTILVDVMLGFVTGYILFTYFTTGINKFNFVNLSVSLFFLTCTKGNGLLLALICLAIIYGDMVFFKRKAWFEYLHIKKFKEILKKDKIKKVLILILPILSVVFTFCYWNIALTILNIKGVSDSEMTGIVTAIFSEQFKERLPSYLEVCKNLFLEYKTFILIFGSLLVAFLGFLFSESKRKIARTIIVPIVFIILNGIYILFLFSVCNIMPDLTTSVIALRRYLLTLVGLYIFEISMLIVYFSKEKAKLSIAILVVAALYITTPASWQVKLFLKKTYTTETIEYRKQYDMINEKLKNVDNNKDIVYYIAESEIDILVSNFETFPLYLSYMPAYQENLTIEEYSNTLFNNERIEIYKVNTEKEKAKLNKKREGEIYIYIYKVTEANKQTYGKIFEYNNIEMQSNTLYKVENVDNIAILTTIE